MSYGTNTKGSCHQEPLGPEAGQAQLPATFIRFTRIDPTVLAP